MNIAISNALEKLRQQENNIKIPLTACEKFQSDKECVTSKTDICTGRYV